MCGAGTLVNVMGLTSTEAAVLQQSVDKAENSMHRNAAAGYISAWTRCSLFQPFLK